MLLALYKQKSSYWKEKLAAKAGSHPRSLLASKILFYCTQNGIVIRYKPKLYFLLFSNYTGLWELYAAWNLIILQNAVLYNLLLLHCTNEKKKYFGPIWEERPSYHLRAWCYFPLGIKKSIWVYDPVHPTASPFSLLYADEPYQFSLAQKDAPSWVHSPPPTP